MSRSLAALALLVLAGCSARPAEAPSGALLDLWAAVPTGRAALTTADVPSLCDETFGTWFEDFGLRGLACTVNRILPLGDAARRAPTAIWASGPHGLSEDGLALDLQADRAFGRYNAGFVEWAAANGVPQSEASARIAQPVYDRYVRRLARVFWLTLRDLEGDGFPASVATGPAADYAAYLDGGPMPDAPGFDGGLSMHTLFGDLSLPIAQQVTPPGQNEWEARYEANTAYGFWLRRRADGTADEVREGLRQLLVALDADWLGANR